jgi:NDP-sugar pyrophosphorylase family protein
LRDWFLPHLKKCVDGAGGKEPIETVFKNIIAAGGKIYAFHTNGAKWFEIDDAEDLKKAEKIFRK